VRSLAITASGEEISVGDVNQAPSLFGTQQATAPGLPLDLTPRGARSVDASI
jgi:hypothetical protein